MRDKLKTIMKDGKTYRDEAKGLSITHYTAIERTNPFVTEIHTWWQLYHNGILTMCGGDRRFTGMWKLAKWFKEIERNPWPIDTSGFFDKGEGDVERQ